MKNIKKQVSLICFFVLTFVAIPRPVHAYLDPGTGSFIIQMLVGGVVAGGAIIKIYWEKIVKLFTRKQD